MVWHGWENVVVTGEAVGLAAIHRDLLAASQVQRTLTGQLQTALLTRDDPRAEIARFRAEADAAMERRIASLALSERPELAQHRDSLRRTAARNADLQRLVGEQAGRPRAERSLGPTRPPTDSLRDTGASERAERERRAAEMERLVHGFEARGGASWPGR